MKKIAITLAALLMALSFASCSGGSSPAKDNKDDTDVEITTVSEDDADDAEDEYDDEDDDEEPVTTSNRVDVDALKSIEDADTFEVKVTKKEVIKGAFSGSISLAGTDALSLEIENKSGKTITDVNVLFVGYTDENVPVKLGDGIVSIGSDPYVTKYTSGEEEYADGSTNTFVIKCRSNTFSGVRTIVYSYTDADGNEVVNPSAENWYKSVIVGANTVLD